MRMEERECERSEAAGVDKFRCKWPTKENEHTAAFSCCCHRSLETGCAETAATASRETAERIR